MIMFGFGSPLTALLMLIVTGFISYRIFKAWGRTHREYPGGEVIDDEESLKERRREYYFEQRRHAQELMNQYNLTDEEIERKVQEEFK